MVGNLILAAVTVALGLGLAKLISTPNYGWAVTITGVSFYLMTISANPLLGFLLWVVTAPFSRFYFLDVKMGRGIPDVTLTNASLTLDVDDSVTMDSETYNVIRKQPYSGSAGITRYDLGPTYDAAT